MSQEIDRKLYNHYKSVIAGDFSTSNNVSNQLRVSDAQNHLADLIKKTEKHSPGFIFEEPKEEIKSKDKKHGRS